MTIGDFVLYDGRRYRLRGIDPMSVTERHAELEELESSERLRVPFDAVEVVDEQPPPTFRENGLS